MIKTSNRVVLFYNLYGIRYDTILKVLLLIYVLVRAHLLITGRNRGRAPSPAPHPFVRSKSRARLTLNAASGMHVLQNAAMMFTQKNGTQHSRNVPMMTPTVMAALWSLT